MKQQVDFLKSVLKPTPYLSPSWIIGIVVLGGVALLGVSISIGIYQYRLSADATRIHATWSEANNAYQAIVIAYPLLASGTPLINQITDFEAKLNTKEAEFQTITHATMRRPFSRYLLALSATIPPEAWLTDMLIDENKGDVSFRGYALNALSVSVFLKALLGTPIFEEMVLDLFAVRKVEGQPYMQFEIANNALLSVDENWDDPEDKKTANNEKSVDNKKI